MKSTRLRTSEQTKKRSTCCFSFWRLRFRLWRFFFFAFRLFRSLSLRFYFILFCFPTAIFAKQRLLALFKSPEPLRLPSSYLNYAPSLQRTTWENCWSHIFTVSVTGFSIFLSVRSFSFIFLFLFFFSNFFLSLLFFSSLSLLFPLLCSDLAISYPPFCFSLANSSPKERKERRSRSERRVWGEAYVRVRENKGKEAKLRESEIDEKTLQQMKRHGGRDTSVIGLIADWSLIKFVFFSFSS